MALKTVQAWFGYSLSSTPSAAQLESRNGVLLLPQDSVVIDESRRGEKKLGEGTFARVYVGMYSGKERAIKVFNGKSDSIVDKAWEEYEKLNSLKHPNIVRVYGMWEDPHKGRNAPAIVMELCDHSLHYFVEQYYPRSSITREDKLKILHDITCAMVYLHSQNVIHGDLRTPNVLVNKTNHKVTAKLTDFGMARVLDPKSNAHFTSSVADVDYLPPEVFNHKEQRNRKKNWAKLTTQVDVFMFGPIAIELACGKFPKPTIKYEFRKGLLTRTYSEIERREQCLTKVKASDRAITDVIVKECLAENPEDRGTFLDLQRIVKGFQRQNNQPDKFEELYGQAQEELEGLRSQLEADQRSLYQQDHTEQLKDAVQLGNDERARLAEQLSAEKATCSQTEAELEKLKEKVKVAEIQAQDAKYTQKRLDEELQKVEKQRQQLDKENTELKLAQKRLEDDGLKHEKLKSTHECLKGKHDNVEGHIKYLEEKSKKDHEECFSLARELKEAKDKVKEVESLSQQTKVANEKMAAELKEKVKLLEKALHQLEEESKTLKREHMFQLLRRKEEIEQLTASSTSLKEVHRELQSKFEILETKSAETEDEVKAVKTHLSSTLHRTDTLQKQLNSSSHAKAQLEIGRTSLLEKVKKLENEQVRLKAEESQLATLRVKHEGGLATIRAKEQELKKARDDLKTRDATTKAHQQTICHLQADVYKSKNFIQAKEAELRKVKEELRFKEDKVKEVESLSQQTKVATEKMAAELKEKVKLLEKALHQLEEESKTLESTTNAKFQLEIGRTSLLEKVKKLENEQVRLKAEESQLATLRVKHEGGLATIRAKEQELKKARDDVKTRDATIKAHQHTICHLQVEVTKSKNFIQAKEAELRKVKEDLRFKEDEVRKAEEASSKSKDVAKATEQYLLSLCLQLETEKDKLHQTRVAKESMTAELKENVEQLERVNQQLEEEKKTLEALKSDYEKKLESLDLKLCNRDKEVDQFKVTIGQKEAKIQAAQEVLSDPSDKYSSASERDQVIQTADMHQSLDHHFQKMTQSLGQMFRDSVAKWPPGGAEVVPAQQWSLPGPAVAFQDLSLLQSSQQKSLLSSSLPLAINTKSYASTAGQTTGSPSLLEPVDPSLLQQALTLQKLMDYFPDLADKGLRIAGRLNMQKQWDSLASSHPELCDRLQKLFAMWLEGEQDSETPHTWGFFISLVQEKGIDQHRLARKICSNLNKAPAPNGASLSSSSLYLQ